MQCPVPRIDVLIGGADKGHGGKVKESFGKFKLSGYDGSEEEQAGLSRATLEISSELPSHFPLRPQKSYSTHFEVIFAPEVVFYRR